MKTDNTPTGGTTIQWTLQPKSEELGTAKVDIDNNLTIGRGSSNDLVLASKQVSRQHAYLNIIDDELFIKDLGSSNGTYVNDKKLGARMASPLINNDIVSFAGFKFMITKTQSNLTTIDDTETDSTQTQATINDTKTETVWVSDTDKSTQSATNTMDSTDDGSANLTNEALNSESERPKTDSSDNQHVLKIHINTDRNIEPKYADIPEMEKKQGGSWVIFILIAIMIGFAALMVV